MKQLLKQSEQLQNIVSSKDSSSGAIAKSLTSFDLNFKRNEIFYYLEYLTKEFDIQASPPDEIHYVETNNKFRPHLIVTILCFIFGIFISVFFDELRIKAR